MNRLQNKIAVVTGSGSGIGKATAIRFTEEGAILALLDLNTEGMQETANQLSGNNHLQIKTDVTSIDSVESAIHQINEQVGQIDILFSGVGGSGRRWGDGPAHDCTPDGWDKTLQLNLTSMFYVNKCVLKVMMEQESGSIINLASVLGLVGGDDDFATHAYAASKSGIIGFSRAMASYYAKHNIRVNVIAPSLIATAMSQRAQTDEYILGRLEQLQPLTGAFGQPEDVAGAAAYLASDDSKFVTGTVLTVDGGWTMR